ncbi:MerR family transcriptional regulator [Streptomyces meridianus]|uniref:MerR family transcriptional regulator n=1 Tax=Streptomyces meridianus TaxID=2938945 RepID=A0ABT0XBH8_9ACTN|nr:MerR family transcriptional regulator [Streptomyces meridianus]MCM2579092.1 MerR family transcriptional regulator [Streptomyces meridianus]
MANDEPGADDAREYRTEELAEAAGISVRTLRFYRERKLLPPPRRDGRIAWYGERHLARLRTIGALLERGHTLGGIAELFAAFESGRDVGELLGLESAIAVPWSEETEVRLSPEALADRFRGEATPENLSASMDLGYITGDGDTVVHVSRRLLDASTALVDRGVPLSVVLAAAREVRSHADDLAGLFTRIIRKHVLAGVLDRAEPDRGLGPDDVARIAETIEQLRPISKAVVDAELAMAMDRRVRAELDAWGRDPDLNRDRDRDRDRKDDRRREAEPGPEASG